MTGSLSTFLFYVPVKKMQIVVSFIILIISAEVNMFLIRVKR